MILLLRSDEISESIEHHDWEIMEPGASIEAALALWTLSLREVKCRMHTLFAQQRTAMNAEPYLDGLLGDGWRMRAEAAGDPGPWLQRAILVGDRWAADALPDIVREYVIRASGRR